jgi:hypothetical protein
MMNSGGGMNSAGGQYSNQNSNSNYSGMFNGGQQMNQYGGGQHNSSQMGRMQSVNLTPLSDMDSNMDPCFQQMVCLLIFHGPLRSRLLLLPQH